MKKNIGIAIGVAVVVIALIIAFKPTSMEKKMEALYGNLQQYQLEGDMEITNGEDIKNYTLTIGYCLKDGVDLFKVDMYDKTINQSQQILRNADGVFVITPNLNQVFQFEGDWPLNSPKPYLLHTIKDVLNGEHEMTKQENGYLISSVASYSSVPSLCRQEIFLDKNAKPMWMIGYDTDDSMVLKITFRTVDTEATFDDQYFSVPKESMKETVSGSALQDVEEGLPWYPMQTFDAILTDENTVVVNGAKQHVLEFSGDKSFTLIQKPASSNDSIRVEAVSGTLIQDLDFIGYYRENCLTVMSELTEISIYSSDLGLDEMIQVVQSLQAAMLHSVK